MKAIILAGGLGVRLRPLTYSIPKPLLPVGEKPILEIIVEKLKSFGFSDFIFAVGYRAELIETYFQDGSKFGVTIHYVREDERSGTAGPLAQVRERFEFGEDGSFLVMNGDILTKLDFARFIDYHERSGCEITVATRKHEARVPFGVLVISEGKVTEIVEKPVTVHDISTGIYLMKSSVLRDVPPVGTFFDIPDLIRKLLSEGRQVGAYAFDEYWLAVDQLHDIEEAFSNIEEWLE